MAWEKRGNHSYYYRSRKVNGRVQKEYLGCDDQANLLAAQDQAQRVQERSQKESWHQEMERWDEAEEAALLLFDYTKLITHAAFVASG